MVMEYCKSDLKNLCKVIFQKTKAVKGNKEK